MTALPQSLTARLAKLLPRLASDQQGEVAATAAAVTRTLKAEGHDWHDLAQHVAEAPREVIKYVSRPTGPARAPSGFSYGSWSRGWHDHDPCARQSAQIRFCRSNAGSLSAWERQFLDSIGYRLAGGQMLTPKQATTLQGIVDRIGGAT